MKPSIFKICLVAALLALAAGVWRSQPSAAVLASAPAQVPCDSTRSVDVSGAAVINVVPDRALLQFGVQSNGLTPDAVQTANKQKIEKVINMLREMGIDAKDIATDYYIVYPVYEDYNALVIKGYRLDNTISVTLKDVNKVGDVIIAALKTGINEVQDVQFYTSELRKYRDQARELAMKAAGEKAQALAGAAGAQPSCVLNISENSNAQYIGFWRGGRSATMWAQNVMQNAAPAPSTSSALDESPVSLGQIAVRAEVSVKYGLK